MPKRALQQVLKQHLDKLNLREGASEEQVDGATADPATAAQSGSKASYHGYDQLDDWHFRGSHPILVNMPLYKYSRWVYRVEFCLYGSANAQAPRVKPRHVDIPFHKDYALGKSWIQRLSREPRVPRIEGMKFHSEATPEMNYDEFHAQVTLASTHPVAVARRDQCKGRRFSHDETVAQ